jgi:hypothetical protein
MRRIGVGNIVAIATAGLALSVAAQPSVAVGGYQQTADMECAAAGLKIEHLPSAATPKVTKRELAIVSALVRQLKKLTPPAAQANRFKKFISETEAQDSDVKAALNAARKGNGAAVVNDLLNAATAGSAGTATAKALGLPACAKDYNPQGS